MNDTRLPGSTHSNVTFLRPLLQKGASELRKQRDIAPLSAAEIAGGGRDPRFTLPQWKMHLFGAKTAFFDAGQGPALIFVHGLAGNLTHFVHVAPKLADRFRVIGLDLPGCGASQSLKEGYSVQLYARHVLGLMDVLGLHKATIVGHSLGGMVATAFALAQPERTNNIVLINPAGFAPPSRILRTAGEFLLREGLLNRVLPHAWPLLLGQVFFQDNVYTQAFTKVVEDTYVPSDVYAMSRMISALRGDFLYRDFSRALSKATVPVHMIWGRQDRLVPAKRLMQVAAKIARASTQSIEDCGHMPIIECPDVVAEAIVRVAA